jgi:hypothetical protein
MTHFRSSVVLALATAPMAHMLPLDRLNMRIDQCLNSFTQTKKNKRSRVRMHVQKFRHKWIESVTLKNHVKLIPDHCLSQNFYFSWSSNRCRAECRCMEAWISASTEVNWDRRERRPGGDLPLPWSPLRLSPCSSSAWIYTGSQRAN